MKDTIKAWKWPGKRRAYHQWWDSLTTDEKVAQKQRFERFGVWNEKQKFPYPHIYDLTHLRLSQLSDKHVDRMHTFKDHQFE